MTPNARIAGLALALTALTAATAARAAEPCLTENEMNQLLLFALPEVLDGASSACKPTLGAGSFLVQDNGALIGRYREAQGPAWPVAREAMMKIPGFTGEDHKMQKTMRSLPDDAIKPMISGIVRQMVAQGVKPADCATIDQAARLLAPLPAENMAGLFTLIVRKVDHPTGNRKSRLPLCPLPPVAAAVPPANR